MYKVIRNFMDVQDGDRVYLAGDIYPAEGVKPTKARIRDLLTGRVATGRPHIVPVNDEPVQEASPAAEE